MQEEFLDQSILLGKALQDIFTKQLKRKDRKVKQAGFIVLHQTFMPSVLVETGFLTNKNEGSYLNSEKGQSEMGKAIAQAVLTYKENVGTGLYMPDEVGSIEGTPADVDASTEIEKPKEETVEEEVAPTNSSETKKPEITETTSNSTSSNTAGVVFKVQLMASAKDIPLTGANFNELDMLSKEPIKNLYR